LKGLAHASLETGWVIATERSVWRSTPKVRFIPAQANGLAFVGWVIATERSVWRSAPKVRFIPAQANGLGRGEEEDIRGLKARTIFQPQEDDRAFLGG
jgi:hypothetical protein